MFCPQLLHSASHHQTLESSPSLVPSTRSADVVADKAGLKAALTYCRLCSARRESPAAQTTWADIAWDDAALPPPVTRLLRLLQHQQPTNSSPSDSTRASRPENAAHLGPFAVPHFDVDMNSTAWAAASAIPDANPAASSNATAVLVVGIVDTDLVGVSAYLNVELLARILRQTFRTIVRRVTISEAPGAAHRAAATIRCVVHGVGGGLGQRGVGSGAYNHLQASGSFCMRSGKSISSTLHCGMV